MDEQSTSAALTTTGGEEYGQQLYQEFLAAGVPRNEIWPRIAEFQRAFEAQRRAGATSEEAHRVARQRAADFKVINIPSVEGGSEGLVEDSIDSARYNRAYKNYILQHGEPPPPGWKPSPVQGSSLRTEEMLASLLRQTLRGRA